MLCSLLEGALPQGAAQDAVAAGSLCESGDVFTQAEGDVLLQRALAPDLCGFRQPLTWVGSGPLGCAGGRKRCAAGG